MERRNYRIIGKPLAKKDADALLRGKGVYTDDLCPADALVVKLLRSPHPHALIDAIDTAAAKKVPGVVDIYTWEDVPQNRFTIAGQTYPEPSPYDRLILDRRLRFVGDAVAIVAAESEKAADKALKLIKVKYDIQTPVLDFRTALDNRVLVHPEADWVANLPVGADNQRNLCASEKDSWGDVEAVLSDCDVVLDRVYHTKACNQAMMETFRTWATTDRYGRLHVVSSTQISKIESNTNSIRKPIRHLLFSISPYYNKQSRDCQ